MNNKDETRLNIKITSSLLNDFKMLAKNHQLSVSALTRLLILDYVEKFKNGQNNR